MVVQSSFGTHDGSFHADEVTACALLCLFGRIDKEKVHRTRDPKILAQCEYVCDVGGVYDARLRRFDHHQADYRGSMSSAGMVLLYLREEGFLGDDLYDCFNTNLILGVDAHDIGQAKLELGTASFSQIVSNFLPIEYGGPEEEMNLAFFQALDFVIGHLDRIRRRHAYTVQCKAMVQKAMAEGTNALLFDRPLPWMENFFALGGAVHPAQFVVMPSGVHWKLRGIPPTLSERMQVRTPMPHEWAGLREEALRKISGIPGAIFCHKGRFISIWETKEDALRALHIIMRRA